MKIDKKFYSDLLDNLYDGVYFVDKNRRITYWNRGMEKLTGFKSSEVRRRYYWDNILMHVTTQGVNLFKKRCPLKKTIADGQLRKTEAYLHHKNGHLLPVLMRVAPIGSSKRQISGGAVILTDNSARFAIIQRLEECRKMALLDPLTKIANRRYIDMNLHTKLEEMHRYKWPLGILFIDIDQFKRVNDTYSHETGDKVLKMVSNTLVHNLRPFDIIGRWGGEEFIAVIANINKDRLYSIADRLRLLVEQSGFSIGLETIHVTVSVGATLAQPNDTIHTLLKRVDKLVYDSKAAGRNRVSIELQNAS